MQQISPKQRPQLIALVVASVLVVGFGLKTTIDTVNTVNAPLTTPVAKPAVAEATVSTPATTTPEAPSTGAFVLKGSYPSSRGRDPLTPVSDSEFAKYSVKIPVFASPPPPPPTPIVTGNTNVFGRKTFQDFRNGVNRLNERDAALKELTGVDRVPPAPSPVVKVLPPPPPPYTVVGVLIGEPGGRDVAILSRNASTDKKFVVSGDALEGGYTVTAIESGGVRVTYPGRRPSMASIPGASPVPVGGSTEYYLPKKTIVTLPLEESKTGASTNVPSVR